MTRSNAIYLWIASLLGGAYVGLMISYANQGWVLGTAAAFGGIVVASGVVLAVVSVELYDDDFPADEYKDDNLLELGQSRRDEGMGALDL